MTKTRKILATALSAAMLFTVALTGCGGGNSSNGGQQTPADNGGASTGDGDFSSYDTYNFNLSMHDPVTTPVVVYYQEWADSIKEATEGHVNITIYGSGTLASSTDCLDMVKGGGVDIGWVYTALYAGTFPLLEGFSLPMIGTESPLQMTEAMWDVYDATPELENELGGMKVLNLYANPINLMMTKGVTISSLADLKGLTLRCPSGPMTEVLSKWGANPITMGPGDMYEALEKNNIAGCVFEPSGVTNFSLQEELTNYTNMNLFDAAFLLVMNEDSWNSLPAEFQQIIDDSCGVKGSLEACTAFNSDAIDSMQVMKDAGITAVDVSDEDRAAFQAIADEYNNSWGDSVTTGDFDGNAYLQSIKDAMAAHAGEYDALY